MPIVVDHRRAVGPVFKFESHLRPSGTKPHCGAEDFCASQLRNQAGSSTHDRLGDLVVHVSVEAIFHGSSADDDVIRAGDDVHQLVLVRLIQ